MSIEKEIVEIKRISKAQGISMWEDSKKYRNYRKSTNHQNCSRCKKAMVVEYRDRKALQCEAVGISGNASADLDDKHVCDDYEH